MTDLDAIIPVTWLLGGLTGFRVNCIFKKLLFLGTDAFICRKEEKYYKINVKNININTYETFFKLNENE